MDVAMAHLAPPNRDSTPRRGRVRASSEEEADESMDTASAVCAYLVVGGVTVVQIGRGIGIPHVVVQEAIRNGQSAPLLRSKLLSWLQESADVQRHVPERLMRQLVDEVVEGHRSGSPVKRRTSSRSAGDDVMLMLGFNSFDSASKERFTMLEETVGQSVMSIFNNPLKDALVSNAEWGGWLGDKLYNVFDYNTTDAAAAKADMGLEKSTHSAGSGNHGVALTESSEQLLQSYMASLDVSDYVELVAPAFEANRLASRGTLMTSRTAESPTTRGVEKTVGEEELPAGVPVELFLEPHDVAQDIQKLPCRSSGSATAITSGVVQGVVKKTVGTTSNASTGTLPPPPKLTRPLTLLTSFQKQNEAIEKRHKELREWESAVEASLLQHVQRRSEDFFSVSRQFGDLHEEAKEALEGVKETMNQTLWEGRKFVDGFLEVGALHRRRRNLQSLVDVLAETRQFSEQLSDVENWVLLPERDITEVPNMIDRSLALESRFASDFWITKAGKLRYTAEWPHRLQQVKAGMIQLVSEKIMEQIQCSTDPSLKRGGSESLAPTLLTHCAIQLGCWEQCAKQHHERLLQSVWSSTQGIVVSQLLGSGGMSDAAANELLLAAQQAESKVEERRRTFSFLTSVPFSVFLHIYTELVLTLREFFSDAALRWTTYLDECVLPAATHAALPLGAVRAVTQEFLDGMVREVESLLVMFLEARTETVGKKSTSAGVTVLNKDETVQVVRLSHTLFPAVLATLRDVEAVLGSPTGVEAGEMVWGLSEMALGKILKPALTQLIAQDFKDFHGRNLGNLRMMLQSEPWQPKDTVNHCFQSHLDTLCAADDKAYKEFHSMSAESGLGGLSSCGNPTSSTGSTGRNADLDDALLNTAAQKIYITANGEDQGRVANDALLILIDLLYGYNEYLAYFPSLAYLIVNNLHELVELYDNYSAELILGGKAVEFGCLKHITPLHLCVASQSFFLLADFLPRFQSRLMRVLGLAEDSPASSAAGRGGGRVPPGGNARERHITLHYLRDQLDQLVANCVTHGKECFTRIIRMIRTKVGRQPGLVTLIPPPAPPAGQKSAPRGPTTAGSSSGKAPQKAPGQRVVNWGSKGHDWVLGMLKEVARVLPAIRPLLTPKDVDCIVAPLIGEFAAQIREVTTLSVQVEKEAAGPSTHPSESVRNDVLLFKVNVEKFGYDVLECTTVVTVDAVLERREPLTPLSSEAAVLQYFFS